MGFNLMPLLYLLLAFTVGGTIGFYIGYSKGWFASKITLSD